MSNNPRTLATLGKPEERLAQITAPHFCAGVVFVGRTVTEAAPILANRRFSLIGWSADRVLAHCRAIGWEIHRVS